MSLLGTFYHSNKGIDNREQEEKKQNEEEEIEIAQIGLSFGRFTGISRETVRASREELVMRSTQAASETNRNDTASDERCQHPLD